MEGGYRRVLTAGGGRDGTVSVAFALMTLGGLHKAGDEVTIFTRHRNDYTKRFPAIHDNLDLTSYSHGSPRRAAVGASGPVRWDDEGIRLSTRRSRQRGVRRSITYAEMNFDLCDEPQIRALPIKRAA